MPGGPVTEEYLLLIRSLGEEWPAARRIDRLQAIRESMPVTLPALKRPPTTSDMLRDVDSHLRRSTLSALNGWKLCSGIAHGSRPVAYNLSERVPLSAPNANGSVQMDLQARITWIASLGLLAQDLLKALFERFSYLAIHDHADRRLS